MISLAIFSILLLTLSGDDCSRVQFYRQQNYEYFLKEFDITGEAGKGCHGLQNYSIFLDGVESVKTDKCIMLYSNHLCNDDPKYISYSIRVETDIPKIPSLNHQGEATYRQRITSFSVCSRELGGGPEVDVDFYDAGAYRGKLSAEFRDVCSCQNLEKSAVGGKKKQISVNNHGNSIDVFEGEHCTGQMRTLDAGVGYSTNWLCPVDDGKPVFDVLSFRPTNYEKCIELDASIYKFQFRNGTDEMINGSKVENVTLAADAYFRNNGAASIVQEYLVSEKITEGLEYTSATGFSNMDTYKADVTVSTEVKAGVPFIADEKVKIQVAAGYQKQKGDSGSSTNKTSVVNEKLVTVRQQITIPPCKVCVASSFVKKVKNFPIAYTAYSRVNGMAGKEKMDAHEIKAALRPEAVYLGDIDAYTVDMKVEGVMHAEYGMNSFINVDCTKIVDCVDNLSSADKKPDFYKMQYIFPI